VKASENQTNGCVACSRKLQPSPFQEAKAYTNVSSLVLELLEQGSMKICKEELFSIDVLESYSIMLDLSQVIIEYLKFFLFCKCFL